MNFKYIIYLYLLYTAACAGYNISSYPQYQNLNTQVVEQANSELGRIKSSLSYMNQRNFMKHLSLFLYFLNQRHLKRFVVHECLV